MTSRRDPSGRSVTLSGVGDAFKDILKGEAISLSLPAIVDAHDIDKMYEEARRRFDKHGLWMINASKVERFVGRARERLQHALKEFRAAGGETLVIRCANPTVATAFLQAARETHGLTIRLAKTEEDFQSVWKSEREHRDRRLREEKG